MEPITSNIVSLHGAASTMIGGRPENQDDLGWTDTPLGFLLVVCDGMGGGPGGKTASYIAKYVVTQTVLNSPVQARRQDVLKMAMSQANDALEQKMNEMPSLRGMGSTLVAILINEDSAVIAHVGDSRCYRLHGKKVIFRTCDHSLVSELVQHKAITEEQARVSPQSNVITRGLGSTNNHVAEIDEVPYLKGDRFVLCTDGVWGIMPHPDLLQRLGAPMEANMVVNNLQAEVDRIGAAEGGFHDNHTLAILDMNTNSRLKDKMSKQVKILLASLGSLFLISLIFNIIGFTKLNKAPQTNEYQDKVTQVARLEQRLSVLENFNNSSEKDRAMQVLKLTEDKEKLNTQVEALNHQLNNALLQNDSLSKELTKANQAITSTTAAATPAKTSQSGKSATRQPQTGTRRNLTKASAKDLAALILAQYQEVEKMQEPSVESAQKKLRGINQEVSNMLDQLGKACKNPNRTDAIKRILPTNDYIEKYIQTNKDGKTYSPSMKLRSEYQRSKVKVEELQKALK